MQIQTCSVQRDNENVVAYKILSIEINELILLRSIIKD